jgi:hypothetical protein
VINRVTGWRRSLLRWLYERLTRNDVPAPADLIFVLAGKMERKRCGLDLYHAGVAERLLLSVGRFEISRIPALHLDCSDELIAERDRTVPGQRHFFCHIDATHQRVYKPHLCRWNTYGEALALRAHLAREPAARVVVVSTDIHLRRVALIFQKVFTESAVWFQYCPVPDGQSSVSKSEWWTRSPDRNYVMSETLKLAVYRAILLMPEIIIRHFMIRRG